SRMLLTNPWTSLINTAPAAISTMILLSDGTVMANASTFKTPGAAWYKLTPDSSGSYVNGTWTQLPPMNDTRYYFPAQMLKDGRVFVAGGEISSTDSHHRNYDIYNPLTDLDVNTPWAKHGTVPLGDDSFEVMDSPSEILPDGRVLLGAFHNDPHTYLYD